jgi:PAS domain S-box-containing protein
MARRFDASSDFQTLFEGAPNLYLVLTPDLKIVAVSDAYCRATMTGRAGILGRGIFEVFPDNPTDLAATGVSNLRSSLERVLKFRRPDAMAVQKYDIRKPESEGGGFEERYWSPLNSPVLDKDGEVIWIIHRVEDVTELIKLQAQGAESNRLHQEQLSTITQLREANRTLALRDDENAKLQQNLVARSIELQTEIAERRKTEEILKSESAFHDIVVNNIPAMVFVKDAAKLRFVLINRAGEELLGIDRSEYIGKSDYDFFPKEQADFFVSRDRAVLQAGGLQVTPEEPINTRHRGRRLLRTLKMAVLDDQGQPKYLLALSEDITERKRAETALRESEIRLRGFLLASPDAMIIVDKVGQILLASHRVETMFGYTSQELAGKSINMLLPERYRNLHTGHIQGFMKKPEGRNMGTGRELNALRKDGSEFPVEINLSPAQTSEGLVVIAAVRNVSAGKAMEKQLRQSQKMEAIGNLTGGMAHDFNNLLGIIIGNLDLLRGLPGASAVTDPKIDQLASEALDAALRGADLTKRLLAFARRQSLRPQRINVNELVQGISKLLNRTLGDDIEIKLNLGAEVWPVDADPSQLGASLINIGNNARDAMPNGGVLTIATSNRNLDEDYAAVHPELMAGTYTLIEVSDTGTGIPQEMLNHIFEPFFTTKEQGKGTGLGLSMVFGFVKQSAGHITVYSEVGHGTTFRLYLPRATTAAAAPETPAVSGQGGHETILAVEDNEGLRRVVVRQLKDLGYRVLEVQDGNAAMKILASEPVDLLFTDIMMPGGMSGYDLARDAVARWPLLKVLLTSGFPETKLNGNGRPPTKMHLLTKPYRKDDLARALRKVLDAN